MKLVPDRARFALQACRGLFWLARGAQGGGEGSKEKAAKETEGQCQEEYVGRDAWTEDDAE